MSYRSAKQRAIQGSENEEAAGAASLRRLQPEESSEVVWEAVQSERKLTSHFAASITSKSLLPGLDDNVPAGSV